MGTKLNPGAYDCYEKAAPDEEMFILLARDPLASFLVTCWANMRKETHGEDDPKAREALLCAHNMVKWRERNK